MVLSCLCKFGSWYHHLNLPGSVTSGAVILNGYVEDLISSISVPKVSLLEVDVLST